MTERVTAFQHRGGRRRDVQQMPRRKHNLREKSQAPRLPSALQSRRTLLSPLADRLETYTHRALHVIPQTTRSPQTPSQLQSIDDGCRTNGPPCTTVYIDGMRNGRRALTAFGSDITRSTAHRHATPFFSSIHQPLPIPPRPTHI